MNRLILIVSVFALLLLLVLWAVWPARQSQQEYAAAPLVQVEPRDIVLYFADSAGLYLVSEERQIAGCNDERQCIAQTIEALAAGSQQLQPIISARTRVLGVEVEEDLARINFSRELVDMHPGGSLSELLTVYGLTNTLAVNFPYLRQLQILREGKIVPTLKGHVDISKPINAEFRYSHAPEPTEVDEQAGLETGAGPVSASGEDSSETQKSE
jgi:hypothetical protein